MYIGFTENIKRRLEEHNAGLSTYTNRYKPWEVVSYTAFNNLAKAEDYERYLKRGSGFAFLKKHLLP